MIKHGIDQEALIKQFSEASAKQGDAVRKTVTETTLKALQGRELEGPEVRRSGRDGADERNARRDEGGLGDRELDAERLGDGRGREDRHRPGRGAHEDRLSDGSGGGGDVSGDPGDSS